MPLNIYVIAHPAIQKMSNQIINSSNQVQQIYNYEILYNLLIYEITRKWLKGQNIYIKNLCDIKQIYKFHNNESYLIMTNLMYCGNIFNSINQILPKVYIQHIDLEKYKTININDQCIQNQIIPIIQRQKIIIIENFIKNDTFLKILDYLLIDKKIEIGKIKIICITCKSSILELLGTKYPLLQVYTTQINYY